MFIRVIEEMSAGNSDTYYNFLVRRVHCATRRWSFAYYGTFDGGLGHYVTILVCITSHVLMCFWGLYFWNVYELDVGNNIYFEDY